MRSPFTANDDQPGPIGRRQISAGGDDDQSVATLTPRTMSSRAGPRKPGHSAGFVFTIGGGPTGSGVAVAPGAAGFEAATDGAETGAATDVSVGASTGSSFACASRRSS